MPLIRWAAAFVRPFAGDLVLIAVLCGCEVGLAALTPWPMKIVVDNVLGARPLAGPLSAVAGAAGAASGAPLLALVILAGLALQLLAELTELIRERRQIRTSEALTLDVRARLFSHLQGLSLRDHARLGPADAVYRLSSDAPFASALVFSTLFPLAVSVLTLASMLIILASIDAALALIAMGAVPLLFALVRWQLKPIGDRAERVKGLESALADRGFQTFAAIRGVKSFVRERFEQQRFDDCAAAGVDERLAFGRQQSAFALAIAAIGLAGTAAVLWVGGRHVLDGRLTLGTLLVVMVYLGAVYRPLSVIAHTAGRTQEALASARRVREMLALQPEDDDDGAAAPAFAPPRGTVAFDRVTFSYGDGPALEDVSFTAARGEIVALVGPTGAGKSTAAALMVRFFDPQAGRILIDGIDVRAHGRRALRAQVALVLQEPLLFKGTVAENIRYGRPDASDAEVRAAAAEAEAAAFIERLPSGYDTPIGDGGAGLSGGERQQICLARALLKKAPILVLDEPTSSLDAETEARVFARLRQEAAARTTIVIAHRLPAILDADRIVLFEAGRVTASGRHDEMVSASRAYRRMWERFCAS